LVVDRKVEKLEPGSGRIVRKGPIANVFQKAEGAWASK
jgi:hypothetical protein